MTPVTAPVAVAAPLLRERELDRKALGSLVWQGAKLAAHFGQYIVLARLVSPPEFGTFALALPWFAVLGVINDGGLSTPAVTARHYDERLASSLHWTQVGLGAVAALAMAGLAPMLAWMFNAPVLVPVGLGLGACLFVGSWSLQPRAALRREMRIGRLALVDIGGSISGLLVALTIVGHTSGVGLLVAAQFATVLTSAALAFTFAPWPLRRFHAGPDYRRALGMGWHMVGADLLNIVRVQFPMLAIGFFATVTNVGLFSRANQLINLPLAVLTPAMANFLLPLLSRTRDRAAEFRRHVRRALALFLAVSIPASVWIAFGPADLIAFVLGEQWVAVVPLLRCLSPLFISQVVSTVAIMTLLAHEESRTVRWFSFWNLVLTAGPVLLAAPAGVSAVAWALAISGLVVRAPLLVWLAVRRGTFRTGELADGLRMLGLLALPAIAGLWAIRYAPLSGLASDALGLGLAAAISLMGLKRLAAGPARETNS